MFYIVIKNSKNGRLYFHIAGTAQKNGEKIDLYFEGIPFNNTIILREV